MVRYITSCLKSLNQDEIMLRLDDYEQIAIRRGAKWVRESSIEEVVVIMSKLGFPLFFVGMDERNPLKAFEIRKGTKEFHRTGKIDKLLELAAKHKYFVKAGRDIIKTQALFSQLLNGSLYVPNKDYHYFMRIGYAADANGQKDLRNVDAVLSNSMVQAGIDDLDTNDIAILFLIRKYDDSPLSSRMIYEILEHRRDYATIQRHIAKLVLSGYINRFGVKKQSSYALTEKGWAAINKARKSYFQGTQFWNKEIIHGQTDNHRAAS